MCRATVADVKVVLATADPLPVPDTESHLIVEALVAGGAQAEMQPWDGGYDWAGADLVVVRSTWDYYGRLAEFLRWADAVEAVTALANPAAVLRWNAHKAYLVEMAGRGVPTVPTRVVRQGTWLPEPNWLASLGPELVVKPAVSVGAIGAFRGLHDDPGLLAHLSGLAEAGDFLVQPFIGSVLSEGESSLMFAAGALSHAVRKVPRDGDYRSQEHHGGTTVPHLATLAELDVAQAALAAAPARCAYARVDLVATRTGPVVMELEVIEPFLFLPYDEGAAERFATAFAVWPRTASTA
jgi:glutathione synthase/RimK-type ligase-like ATP-grasp enzyme